MGCMQAPATEGHEAGTTSQPTRYSPMDPEAVHAVRKPFVPLVESNGAVRSAGLTCLACSMHALACPMHDDVHASLQLIQLAWTHSMFPFPSADSLPCTILHSHLHRSFMMQNRMTCMCKEHAQKRHVWLSFDCMHIHISCMHAS